MIEAEVGPETRVTITVLLNVALLPDGRGDLAPNLSADFSARPKGRVNAGLENWTSLPLGINGRRIEL